MGSSALPYKRSAPSWLKATALRTTQQIARSTTTTILDMARKGIMPSQIGVCLRDSHGIPQVNAISGSKILRILKLAGMAPEIPEDLYFLIKKAVSIRRHLECNRKDKDSKFHLILVESCIHRLTRYYKMSKKIPPTWKYESSTASALVA